MTNTARHRALTTTTTTKAVAAGILGAGALAAFPAMASAQDTTAEPGSTGPATASQEAVVNGDLTAGSKDGAQGGLEANLGSVTIQSNLDAQAPAGSVELGSVELAPNTASLGDALPTGSLGGDAEAPAEGGTPAPATGSLAEQLAGLGSKGEATGETGATGSTGAIQTAATGSLGGQATGDGQVQAGSLGG